MNQNTVSFREIERAAPKFKNMGPGVAFTTYRVSIKNGVNRAIFETWVSRITLTVSLNRALNGRP